MALGGGTFVSENKILPGAYINFISTASANAALSDRGIAALAHAYDWGKDDELMIITRDDFLTKSSEILGYDYGHDKLKGMRELFNNIHTLVTYNLSSGGSKAENDYATAKYTGVRGNDIKIIVKENVDNNEFEVSTSLDNRIVDVQTVTDITELEPNAYVDFKTDATLIPTAGESMINGSNGEVDVSKHQRFLDLAESQSFNAIGVVSDDPTLNSLYATYAKRMREEVGKKFQAVVHNHAADYEGVVNVKNTVVNEGSLVYWVLGVVAGTPVNQSALNKIYDGEFEPVVDYTQAELEQAIQRGEFTFHQVGQDVAVLDDINSLVTTTAEKGEVFKDNQTIRVIDQIANDVAGVFSNKYLGKIPNDQSGRVSLESDIVSIHENLQDIRAIENFSADDVTVTQGNDKKSVRAYSSAEVVNTMAKLYMTTVVA